MAKMYIIYAEMNVKKVNFVPKKDIYEAKYG